MTKKKRTKERTFGSALRYGALVCIVVAVAGVIALLNDHNSAAYDLYRMKTAGVIISHSSELYQNLMAQLAIEDLCLTPLSLLAGGVAIGLLAPSRASLKDVLFGSAKMSAALIVAAFLFLWGLVFVLQSYKINPGQFSPTLAVVQIVVSLFEIAICVLGGALGYGLRTVRGRRVAATQG